ncbi:MAG: carboxypeptidase regulatory-like domain-containing protein [Bacteroidales bacterium]|nr:carboxypeptidase regulatory-like domain-containing protein [Bacteroidales bacterium]MBR4215956.1 carboxypeptidase regulatory-like domain-containing protein [Bacteroidales bacterium]
MKNFWIKSITLILICLWVDNAFAQQQVFEVRGRILDDKGKPVQFAHLINLKKATGTLSDTAGRFRILMVTSDTIKITCLGFEDAGFVLTGQNVTPDITQVTISDIVLKTRIYELGTVNVFSERWNSFLYDYTHQAEPKSDTRTIESWFKNIINPEIVRQISASASVGIPISNPNRRRMKADKQISKFEYQEELSREANERYNPQVVASITGISEEEAAKFIQYCHLSREYILQKSDYDLYIIISQLYKEYQKIK